MRMALPDRTELWRSVDLGRHDYASAIFAENSPILWLSFGYEPDEDSRVSGAHSDIRNHHSGPSQKVPASKKEEERRVIAA